MGDLREGILPCDIERTVEEIIDLQGINLIGIGANMACLSGAKPTVKNMAELSCIAERIQRKNGIELEVVSGGNSANYEWFISTDDVGLINNLRLGEAILLGCETLCRKRIPNLYTDAFTLVAEVIELKTKYSKPPDEICQDSFGNKVEFQDRGYMRRAILGIGKQDIDISRIKPRIIPAIEPITPIPAASIKKAVFTCESFMPMALIIPSSLSRSKTAISIVFETPTAAMTNTKRRKILDPPLFISENIT